MAEIWRVEERPDNMRRREVVNALSFDQMVTYKKLFDARMKKEGKGEQVLGYDVPIPVTVFEAGPGDCSEQLHAVRYVGFAVWVLFFVFFFSLSLVVTLVIQSGTGTGINSIAATM
jgi:hypothetical protein